MWRWIKHWRDWAMLDFWPLKRTHPTSQGMHVSYEKAGLIVHDQPIPWNAEAVLVEAVLRLPTPARAKNLFHLLVPGGDPIPVETLRSEDADRHRLFFRFPLPNRPTQPTSAELIFRNHQVLGRTHLPTLSAETFIAGLRLEMPTLFVRIGDQSVACETFVATQCRGLLASAVLSSPTSLVPILDLGLHVTFESERPGESCEVPVPLSSTQLAGKRAILTVAPTKSPRRIGPWTASWKLAGKVLATHRIRGISQKEFHNSLRLIDTRFIVSTATEDPFLTKQPPLLSEARRVGPCFILGSNQKGMAGMCALRVVAQVPGAIGSTEVLAQEVLVTDGPTLFAPGTVDVADLARVHGFELMYRNRSLGSVSLCPVPTATFTSEGGFRPPTEFSWGSAAEEQLVQRLSRLMNGDSSRHSG